MHIPCLEASWQARLNDHLNGDMMRRLDQFLIAETAAGKRIYPPSSQIFAAFAMTPFAQVKVVILGQDPYHRAGQAHGLSFSVPHGITPPPSLANIYKELGTDLGIANPGHTPFNDPLEGKLAGWAHQGVLLLNNCLTVEDGKPGAHAGKGWEEFTDAAVDEMNTAREHLVFILWGRKAQQKGRMIDRTRHLVLQSAHPSPLSAHTGFFGSAPFSKTNRYLASHSIAPISW